MQFILMPCVSLSQPLADDVCASHTNVTENHKNKLPSPNSIKMLQQIYFAEHIVW